MFKRSPVHYVGNKYKLLPQLSKYFPNNIETLYEPFTGSMTIPLNLEAKEYIVNDKNEYVVDLHNYLLSFPDIDSLNSLLKTEIKNRGLSQTNQEAYLELRNDYNLTKKPHLFFLLICYTFNNQIRFNSKGCFNNPFGLNRSSFNSHIEKNLHIYHRHFKGRKITLMNNDYRCFFSSINPNQNDFVYIDPPYLISNATYNGECKQGGWGVREENELLAILDTISHKTRFMVSNVLENKGYVNEILLKWSKKYNVIDLDYDYNNSYAARKKTAKSREVIITSY